MIDYFGHCIQSQTNAVYRCPTAIAYAIAYFLPIILRDGMGYSVGAAQCLVAPPYAFTAIVMFITSWFSDKYRLRGPVLVFNSMLSIIGLAIMVSCAPWGYEDHVLTRREGLP